jgi:hypothetical protein
VTYTTHADYTFLDNLEPLLERWRGPISIALHAPGTDFPATIEAIKHARSCGSPLVAQLVTFHVYFSSKHVPKMVWALYPLLPTVPSLSTLSSLSKGTSPAAPKSCPLIRAARTFSEGSSAQILGRVEGIPIPG